MSNSVVIYVSNQCNQSEKLISFLDYLGIHYRKKNVSESRENMKDLQKQNVFSTPATFVDEDYKVLGYQENQLRKVLGINSGNRINGF